MLNHTLFASSPFLFVGGGDAPPLPSPANWLQPVRLVAIAIATNLKLRKVCHAALRVIICHASDNPPDG